MKEVKDSICTVVDHGLWTFLAEKLGEQFKHVYYWSPYDTFAPKIQEAFVGDGLPNVERALDIWHVKSETDVFCFPDVGFAGLQRELRYQGIPVWGHGGGDELETNRRLFLASLLDAGLSVPKFVRVQGLTELRAELAGRKNCFVKLSKYRGDFETFHWVDKESSEGDLDYFAYKLGPAKEVLAFYVFDNIETDIEDGFDAYFVNGWPSVVIHGMEKKDKALLGTIQAYADLPAEVLRVSDAYAHVLRRYDYRGFFSAEIRIKDGESYFIDPTCRAASPPSQVMVNAFKNLGEIILAGAHGELIEPVTDSEFVAQVQFSVQRDKSDWLTLDVPASIRQFVKVGFACGVGNRICVPPNPLGNMAGWIVAEDNSVRDVVAKLKQYKTELPPTVECDVTPIADLIQQVESAEEKGMEFTEQQMPDPAIVVDRQGEA